MMEKYDILDVGEGVLSKIQFFLFAAGEDDEHRNQQNEFRSKFSLIDGIDPRDSEQSVMDAGDNGEVALWELNPRQKQRSRKNSWPRKKHRGSIKIGSLEYFFHVENFIGLYFCNLL